MEYKAKRVAGTITLLLITFSVLIICTTMTTAQVWIAEVLVNPNGTQSGGEAVLLYADRITDISGYTLKTGSSENDATIPSGTILCDGCVYLIADTGWQTKKDQASWRDADYEETITLVNTHSGVALITPNGSVEDVVGWGDSVLLTEPFNREEPVMNPVSGVSLRRSAFTGNPSQDFSAQIPMWTAPPRTLIETETELVVGNKLEPTLNLPDQSNEEGVQWYPNASILVEVTGIGPVPDQITMTFANEYTTLTQTSAEAGVWTFHGEVPKEEQRAPGQYQVLVAVTRGSEQVVLNQTVTIVRVRKAQLEGITSQVTGNEAEIHATVQNAGNIPLKLGVSLGPVSKNNTIKQLQWLCKAGEMAHGIQTEENKPTKLTAIIPGERIDIICTTESEVFAVPGTYRIIVRIVDTS